MNNISRNNKKENETGKAHSYIFKWYACGYFFIGVVVVYMNYDKWF
tara:strand:- start:17 stop:154 length:138 start_codon:yes stop_codon:yes gene_type:complete